jgi:hypothetical protein
LITSPLCYSGCTMRNVRSLPLRSAVVLLLCCLPALQARRAGAAVNTVPYYNLKHAFAFAYPSDWIKLRVTGADYAVLAPDLNGVLSVTVGPGTASNKVLQKSLRAAFIPFGRPIHAPDLGTYNLKGGTAQQAQVVVETADKHPCAITALAVSHNGHVYVILLVVQNTNQASAAADSDALETILASFALF